VLLTWKDDVSWHLLLLPLQNISALFYNHTRQTLRPHCICLRHPDHVATSHSLSSPLNLNYGPQAPIFLPNLALSDPTLFVVFMVIKKKTKGKTLGKNLYAVYTTIRGCRVFYLYFFFLKKLVVGSSAFFFTLITKKASTFSVVSSPGNLKSKSH